MFILIISVVTAISTVVVLKCLLTDYGPRSESFIWSSLICVHSVQEIKKKADGLLKL